MKILVLGNGFDLDHNLPTGYKDFLYFCLYIINSSNAQNDFYDKLTSTQKKYVRLLNRKKNIKKHLSDLLENNHLFTYFRGRLAEQGEAWIDLERELRSIVHELESLEEDFLRSKLSLYTTDGEQRIHEIIQKLGLDAIISGKINELSLNLIHSKLQKSLRDFCKALEIYIVTFINNTPVNGISPDIIDFDATDVITFNYSNTYQRVYGGIHLRENINHIHGIACNNNSEETNIVLGITTPSEEVTINRYVDFQKYFQRITKKTENTYRKWLLSRYANKAQIEVAFFGHSLDASDSDIIKDLICHENTKIIIYYYNDTAHQNIVANLVEILNKRQIIDYTSGDDPKIIFKQQRPHQHNNTAGVEIERDIRKLYKMYSLKNAEINKLIERILKKVDNQKLSYFYSQEKTISLFEAMKFANIEGIKDKQFIDICASLNFETSHGGKLKKYRYSDWYGETSWGETLECNKDTKKLIDETNRLNELRFQALNANKPYSYLHTLSSVEQMKYALLKVFDNDPSETYWKNLHELMYEMVESDLLKNSIDELVKEPHPIYINAKINQFYMAYYEIVNDYYMQKQWEEDQKSNYTNY